MEQRVDAVAAIRLDDAEVLSLGVLFDDIAEVFDGNTGFYMGNCLVQTFTCTFDEANVVRITSGFVAYIVGLVQVAVVAFVEEGDVEVENVAVLENSLVWDAVADDLVDGCAE